MKQHTNPTHLARGGLLLLALCCLTGIAHGDNTPDQWRNEITAQRLLGFNPQASESDTILMALGINITLLAVTAYLLLRLRRSNRKLESLAETQRIGQMGSWELALASGRLTWSEEIYRIFEIDPLQFSATYEAFMNAIHPDDREAVNKAYRESLENRTSYFIEHRLLFADGRIKYVRECCETFYRADGKPVRSVGTVQDISERKRLETELRQQANFQQSLLDALNQVGMQLMVIEEKQIVYLSNRKLAHEFGYTNAELDAGPALFDLIHPDDRARVLDFHLRRLSGESIPDTYELGLVTRHGERREYETSVALVHGSSPLRTVSIGKDIGERKRLEAELVQREREFRTLAENSPDIIVRFNSECRYVYANPVFEKKSGFRLDDLRGKKPVQVPGLSEAEFIQQRVLKVIESGLADEFEHSAQGRDGNTGWRLVSIFPELDTAGRVAHVQVLSRNITALKETERHLEESRERLRQLLAHQENNREEERKKLAGDMHEDLLQILSAMQMNGKLLQSNSGGMPAHITKTLRSLISGLGKSINLVRNMVVSLRPTVLNLGIDLALEWLVDEFTKRHPGKACKLTCTNADQMEEKSSLLVFRIVQEALEAAGNIAGASNVCITLHREEGGYLLTIRNEDAGDSLEVSADNFLNLSGLQERVFAMGGEMVIFSEPDCGLIIQAKLPHQDAD